MNAPPSGTARVPPDAALAAVAAHRGPVIIDFDETLYLRSSTEDFLDCARPALIARLLMMALERVAPWRWLGGPATRDNWRIICTSLFFPWVWWIWRLRVRSLAKRYSNRALAEYLDQRSTIIIASIGFRPIIAPLLRAMALKPEQRLVACRIMALHDRKQGKRGLVVGALGEDATRQALVLTDSYDDAPLLELCARPCLTVWPDAHWREAHEAVYLPFQYLSRVKRPGEHYLWRSILQEDYAFWVLASVAGVTALLPHLTGLALLLLSFWAIYETGYVDNDRMGARYEAKPKLSATFANHRVPTPALAPWIWAAASGYAGLAMLHLSPTPPLAGLLAWAGVLIATFACFRTFNRIDKRSRIWLFALLQVARAMSFVAVVAIAPLGAAALGAHIVALWMPYVFYRYVGDGQWLSLPVFSTRLLFFLIFGLLIFAASGPDAMHWEIGAALLFWNLLRARRELPQLFARAHRTDNDESRQRQAQEGLCPSSYAKSP